MIYIVIQHEQPTHPGFFLPGDVFEGELSKGKHNVKSLSKTGTYREAGMWISKEKTKELGKTWKEVKKEYPEYFL